jgi:arylsulfatase A-like enzyme
VVAIVYDQFPSWAYDRYGDLLSPEGALRRTRSRGASHIVEYPYATTHTAPGHAAIFSGRPPSENGVAANELWTPERGLRSVVDDGEHAVFGLPDAFASPGILLGTSVADALRQTHPAAKIVGLAGKDRSTVLAIGRDPDLALWYEKRLGRITSSSYYGEALPGWVESWIAANPIERYFDDWDPADPESLQRLLGPDDAPGEGDYQGFGTTFPHNPGATRDPGRTFRAAPRSTEYLLDLARIAVRELELGADDIPDLLALSVSSLDYTGHVFGPDSWEYVDHLVRIDAAVGTFLAELEETTSVAVLITSDHGGGHLPEIASKDFPDAGRVYPDTLPEQMNAAIERVLGDGDWVGAYAPPFVYLTPSAREPDVRDRATEVLIDALEALPEVHSAHDAREATSWRNDPDPLRRAVGLSVPADHAGDVFVVLAPGSVADEGFERGKGTGHGSPWPHDRQVPVLFAGPGVTHTSSTTPLAQDRVAATLCDLLGIAPPERLRAIAPLPGSGEAVVRILRLETRDLARYRESLAEGQRIMSELGVTPEIRLEIEDDSRDDGVVVARLRIGYPDRATREDWAVRLERSDRYNDWAGSLDAVRTVLSDEER